METVIKYLLELKCVHKVANLLNTSIGSIYYYKRRYEKQHGVKIQCESRRSQRLKKVSEK